MGQRRGLAQNAAARLPSPDTPIEKPIESIGGALEEWTVQGPMPQTAAKRNLQTYCKVYTNISTVYMYLLLLGFARSISSKYRTPALIKLGQRVGTFLITSWNSASQNSVRSVNSTNSSLRFLAELENSAKTFETRISATLKITTTVEKLSKAVTKIRKFKNKLNEPKFEGACLHA